MKLTHQLDFFYPNPNESDLASYKGATIPPGVTLINAPKWNVKDNRWEALANVGGALCIVELNVKTIDR
jgi:hypothetical protein